MKRLMQFLAIALLSFLLIIGWRVGFTVATESTPAALVQAGKQQYEVGQFAAAVQQLQQAVAAYQASGDRGRQAQTLGLLSLVYQKLGQWQAAQEAIQASLQLLNSESSHSDRVRAQIFNAEGHLYLATGKAETALETWRRVEQIYQQLEDATGVIGSQINQAQALQTIGFYRQARQQLDQLEQQIRRLPDSSLKLAGLHSLGNLRRQGGDLEQAEAMLQQALVTARKLRSPEDEGKVLTSLGNTYYLLAGRSQDFENSEGAERYIRQASTAYQQAAVIATSPITHTQAQLNQLKLYLDEPATVPPNLITEIATDLNALPASRAAIDARINFAHSLMKLDGNPAADGLVNTVLQTAVQQAERLQDPRALSYALGTFGAWYEQRQDWTGATTTTRQALQLAQSIKAAELSYQWQWQLGRLLQAQKNPVPQAAIAYYREALQTLTTLRNDLTTLNSDIQFTFREQVEPVYRQYVDLLLQDPQPPIAHLIAARQTIEALQLAEIDNFFRDACARPQPVNIDDLDPRAAIIYPIVLSDRLEVIVKLPGKDNLRHARIQGLSTNQIDQAVAQLQRSLKRRSTSLSQVKREAQQIYDWLLKPFEADLAAIARQPGSAIQTLVFVLDGSLQNIPPAVLHDGKSYLIERYAIAVTPGLQLLDPKPLPRTNLNALLTGASNAPSFQKEGFGTIDNVAIELAGVEAQVNRSQTLEEQEFIKEKIQSQIDAQQFNVVHIATHGQFSSNPDQTFILDWNKRIPVKDLDTLLRTSNKLDQKPIELLVLSACETATGDRRAALGLAGIAIRAGARSTLATLFQVNDAATAELMIRFYQQLNNPQLTKVEALRQAQLSFLQPQDEVEAEWVRPYFWASFILVGNWL